MRYKSNRKPFYQCRGNLDFYCMWQRYFNLLDQLQGSGLSHKMQRNFNGCQGGIDDFSFCNIVKSDDGNVFKKRNEKINLLSAASAIPGRSAAVLPDSALAVNAG